VPNPDVTAPRLLHVKGAGFGGDSVLIVELGRSALRRGFEVDVLATDPRFHALAREAGLGVVDLDVIRRPIRPLWDVRGLARLRRFLARSGYTIVHTHTSKAGFVGRLAATRVGVPAIVHTPHLFPFHEESGRASTAAYLGLERLAARWCDTIVTVSEFHREWALRVGIGRPEQIVAIPNGVPTDRARPTRRPEEVRAELGLGDSFMALSTGRLAEQKGLEYLIRAAPLLRAEAPSTRIVIAGDGPLAARLARLVSDLRVDDVVSLLGFRSDVGDLLAASDLVVLPSLWEGLSISLLEAMAAGKPVVTTLLGSNREVTDEGKAAVLVPPKDPAALADAIRALMSDPARCEALGSRGLGVQRERYTLRRMLDAYEHEYDRLLRQPSRRRSLRHVQLQGT
jgi:glycosyltransferase involved in cell wall biosynthesis